MTPPMPSGYAALTFDTPTNKIATSGYGYDEAGNVLTTPLPQGATQTYDAESRMVQYQDPFGTTSYVYDAQGRRVKSVQATATTVYIYDGSGELAAEYGDAAVAGRQYLFTDHLGSTRLITNDAGVVKQRMDYLPFGGLVTDAGCGLRCGMPEYLANADVRVKFTGKERDSETGLDYFGARYFSGAQGRFTSPDLAGPDPENPQTLNKYRYALNNPLRYVDKNGLYEEDVHRDLTRALAIAAGISPTVAVRIAAADQGVDDNPATSPMGMNTSQVEVEKRANYHFTTPERREEMWGRFETTGSAEFLGQYLHAEQDSYSHAGYRPKFGHAIDGHSPDKTYNNPDKADRMAADTYSRLLTGAAKVMDNRQAKSLSPTEVANYAARFDRARTDKEKKKVLQELIEAAQKHQ